MKTFSITDKGKAREVNQDYVFTSEKPVGNLPNLFIVADGMGGHNAGDYASRYAVEIIVDEIKKNNEKEPAVILKQAIEQANKKLVLKAGEELALAGMGTTAVLATLDHHHLWVANVGDSRLYLLNDKIRQITKDHSYVEELVRTGRLKEDEARLHPKKNVITRAIGVVDEIDVDVFEVEINEQEDILMCTDGLTNMIEDKGILTIVNGQRDIVEKVERLVDVANHNGGEDNITVIIIEPFSNEVKSC